MFAKIQMCAKSSKYSREPDLIANWPIKMVTRYDHDVRSSVHCTDQDDYALVLK